MDKILEMALSRRDAALADARMWDDLVARLILPMPVSETIIAAPSSGADLPRTTPVGEEASELASPPDPQPEVSAPASERFLPVDRMERAGIVVSQRTASRWTEQRILFLRRHVPTARSWVWIWEEFHKLPGEPAPNLPTLKTFIYEQLKLKRLEKPPVSLHEWGVDPIPGPAVPEEPPRFVADRFEHVVVEGVRIWADLATRWTAERIRLIRRDYPTVRRVGEIIADLNALPGETITDSMLRPFVSTKMNLIRLGQPLDPVHSAQPVMLTTSPDMPPETRATLVKGLEAGGFAVEPDTRVIDAPPLALGGLPSIPQEPPPHVPPRPVFSIVAPAPPPKKPTPPPPVRTPELGPRLLAKALELPPEAPVSSEPIEADAATIRATVSAWGMGFRGEIDLKAVNDAAFRRGARPFRLMADATPKKRRKCLHCEKMFDAWGKDNWICDVCLPTVSRGVPNA